MLQRDQLWDNLAQQVRGAATVHLGSSVGRTRHGSQPFGIGSPKIVSPRRVYVELEKARRAPRV
jgi:hypothetical protein